MMFIITHRRVITLHSNTSRFCHIAALCTVGGKSARWASPIWLIRAPNGAENGTSFFEIPAFGQKHAPTADLLGASTVMHALHRRPCRSS